MRYVRQVKKPKNGNNPLSTGRREDPATYDFPEIEEFFVYSPGGSGSTGGYNTGTMSMGGASKGIKMTRDSITYCTSGLVDRNKGSTLS